MARINVEQKALSDPRFAALARLLKLGDTDRAIGRMVRVWNECIERHNYVLPCWVVEAIFDDSSAPAELVTVELAEWVTDDTLRIKGTEGRTDYLGELRNAKVRGGRARAAGAERDPKNGTFTSTVQHKSPAAPAESSAPAPDPAPDLKKKNKNAAAATADSAVLRSGRCALEFTETRVAEWRKAFPDADPIEALPRMQLWIKNNPGRRARTVPGLKRFVTGWLGRNQDDRHKLRGGGVQPRLDPEVTETEIQAQIAETRAARER